MLDKLKIKWVYGICAIFIVLNCIFVANEFYWFSIFPAFLLILLLFIFSLDILLLLIVFLTPLSVNLSDFNLNIGINIPTEPILFGVMILFIVRVVYEGGFDRNVLRHPVSIAILFYLLWIFITSFTSSLPLVSFKFFICKLWFVIPIYFLGTQLFKNFKNIRRFVWMYLISFLIVIFYTIFTHSKYGFDEQTSHWVMSPFYNDHTSYGALLAMFIPFTLAFIFDKKLTKIQRIVSFFFFVIFCLAIALSYCRAAWVSLAIAFLLFLIIKLKINYKIVIMGIIGLVSFYLLFRFDIILKLEKNKQDSSKDYIQHIQSISNISSDASNLERFNRWDCALRMFKERPVFGWGPGSYQFKYAPFQHSKEKTPISTNAGDKGNAHSEYIGPLSEEGVFGLLSVVAIIVLVSYTALKVYKRAESKDVKYLVLVSIVSLCTYFVHGCLNNFLDTDKASVPFWGIIAIIVTLDIYHSHSLKQTNDGKSE